MAWLPEFELFAAEQGLPIVTIEDLVAYAGSGEIRLTERSRRGKLALSRQSAMPAA